MNIFDLFKSNKNKLSDFSFLTTDFHSHLVPGIDDGAKTLEDSVHLIKELYQLGFRNIITTPHVMSGMYENKSEDILKGLNIVREALEREGLTDLTIGAAAEYMLDEGFEQLLEKKDVLTFGDNYVLFELSLVSGHPGLERIVFKMRTKGYNPILAHPERYIYWRDNISQLEKLKDMGCKLQCNILSLTGYYGAPVKKFALRLFKLEMIDFLCTDLHHQKHLNRIKTVFEDNKINNLLSQYKFQNQTIT